MTRNQIRTILITAIVLYCIGCAVACNSDVRQVKQPKPDTTEDTIQYFVNHSEIKEGEK